MDDSTDYPLIALCGERDDRFNGVRIVRKDAEEKTTIESTPHGWQVRDWAAHPIDGVTHWIFESSYLIDEDVAAAITTQDAETSVLRGSEVRELNDTIARLTAELDAGDVTFEVWQDDMPVAESDDIEGASHYASMYAQDGPVEVFRKRTTREKIAAIAGAAK